MLWIYLVLIVAVLVFGFGVVLWNRRRAAVSSQAPSRPALPVRPPPEVLVGVPAPSAAVDDEVAIEDDALAEPELAVERPSFRSRMSKARSAFTGALLGIAGRTGITTDTWDDLEEALLRADVGVRVTDELLALDGRGGAQWIRGGVATWLAAHQATANVPQQAGKSSGQGKAPSAPPVISRAPVAKPASNRTPSTVRRQLGHRLLYTSPSPRDS